MAEDPEIKSMGEIAAALEGLDVEARRRVLDWSANKFGIDLGRPIRSSPSGIGGHVGESTGGDEDYAAFVDLFDVTNPKTEPSKALVGGYWFQVTANQVSFDAQQVNSALKDVGHGIGNITSALSALQQRKPALVRQMAKSGRTKQARKTYKLTTSGIAEVRKMIQGEPEIE